MLRNLFFCLLVLSATVAEAAEVLGISRNLAYSAIRRGEIPALRIGRRYVIPVNRLEQLLAGTRQTGVRK